MTLFVCLCRLLSGSFELVLFMLLDVDPSFEEGILVSRFDNLLFQRDFRRSYISPVGLRRNMTCILSFAGIREHVIVVSEHQISILNFHILLLQSRRTYMLQRLLLELRYLSRSATSFNLWQLLFAIFLDLNFAILLQQIMSSLLYLKVSILIFQEILTKSLRRQKWAFQLSANYGLLWSQIVDCGAIGFEFLEFFIFYPSKFE